MFWTSLERFSNPILPSFEFVGRVSDSVTRLWVLIMSGYAIANPTYD